MKHHYRLLLMADILLVLALFYHFHPDVAKFVIPALIVIAFSLSILLAVIKFVKNDLIVNLTLSITTISIMIVLPF